MIYLLDTCAISDMLVNNMNVISRVEQHLANRDTVAICRPVYYELMRGLVWRKSPKKRAILDDNVLPKLDWQTMEDADWLQAALFWANAISAGRHLSDVDFLIATIAHRIGAIIVSSDADFDALPVKRENWREPLA